MNLEELRKQSPDKKIPYGLLLLTDEWNKKREEIIERDHHMCTRCGTTKSFYHQGKNIRGQKTVTKEEKEAGGWGMIEIEDTNNYNLQVHHKLYILNKLPWEYDNEQLVTLCNVCHGKVHEENTIPIYGEDGVELKELTPCSRCNGMGRLPEYSHVQNGICFKCYGEKYINIHQ